MKNRRETKKESKGKRDYSHGEIEGTIDRGPSQEHHRRPVQIVKQGHGYSERKRERETEKSDPNKKKRRSAVGW
jgi:hypothetical protein